MRLWHKDLISVLPRQQLLSQWRECCCIARNISKNGTPNHILVNKIMDFPYDHFVTYARLIFLEMLHRHYNCDWYKFSQWIEVGTYKLIDHSNLFASWHNNRYLRQCVYNLQEKYDCGGITEAEWRTIAVKVWQSLL